ncbi:tripartite motif-containing protein 16-like [Trichomycterus rosablanca]|uniref:tripartite motif-containing protein 16-like n=1 Tax=Trichomycterus rosablanca TaxID=2290929 RepID=UPI002F35D23E
MAESNISVAQDEFSCSVCLETLEDPVTTSCGHSFCMVCINKHWDKEDDKETYSCPQCRKTFTARPVVSKNIILAGVVEKLKKKESQVPLPFGPEDVECDFCTGRKYKAVKSCLVCLASYCETHIQPHYESPAFKKHKLVKASRQLQDQICSQHDKLLEVYCRTDQQCICLMCTMDDHKGHDTISAEGERAKKQMQLLEIQREFQEKIQNREKELNELINAVESHKFSAKTSVKNIERICAKLINSIRRRCSEVKDLIRDQRNAKVSKAEKVVKQLEEEIVDLKKKDAELEQLSHTEDPIHFLQKQLLKIQRKFQEKIQNREKELNELINAVESHKCSAQTSVKNIERICTKLMNLIRRRCSEVKELIRDREKAEVSEAEKVLKQLEEEIVDLKKKDAELEQLSHTEDPIHFLQSFQSLSTPAGSAESPAITINLFLSFDKATESVSQLKEKVEEFWKEQFEKIPDEVKKVRIISPPKPEIREDFLQYFCQFTLDPNTVNKNLRLSEENKVVTRSGTEQSYPDHPDRFNYYSQVLCRESVSGRCYWEVEWSGNNRVCIAVSYKSIRRKARGSECWFGCNDQSWILFCSPSRFLFRHNNKGTKTPIMPSSSRIGVYVDYKAGTLSFYSVSDTMKLLHRVQTTFTQLLYPGFWVGLGTKVKLSDSTK